MREPTKFSFDRDFRQGSTNPFVERRKDPTVPLELHEQAVHDADSAAFMRGHGAGIEAARQEQTARLAFATEQLTHILQQHTVQLQQLERQASTEALSFALQFAELLAGSLIEKAPLVPIEAAARRVFGDLRGVPHLAVRVMPDLVEPVRESLARIAREIGMDAKIIVLGEPEIYSSDCRIEWADGGIICDRQALILQLKNAIRAALGQNNSSLHISDSFSE